MIAFINDPAAIKIRTKWSFKNAAAGPTSIIAFSFVIRAAGSYKKYECSFEMESADPL
jgi:hypothetical protein